MQKWRTEEEEEEREGAKSARTDTSVSEFIGKLDDESMKTD